MDNVYLVSYDGNIFIQDQHELINVELLCFYNNEINLKNYGYQFTKDFDKVIIDIEHKFINIEFPKLISNIKQFIRSKKLELLLLNE